MKNSLLNLEEFKKIVLDNGITVLYCNKESYSKKVVSITTKFGSIHNAYNKDGQEFKLHDGIAHFLEHKMFEKEDENFLNMFSKYGANVNAYTTFDHTSYYFSCTNNFEESFDMLLKMMTTPYFTEETVEKEKGIINEEIKMYKDSPDARLFFELLKSLYENHSINVDIAGDIETVDKITAKDLHDCFKTFYNPNNIVITLVGDINLENAIKQIDEYYKDFKAINNIEFIEQEDNDINRKEFVVNMDVNMPKTIIGFKRPFSDKYCYKREVALDIYLEMHFGKSSEFYEMLSQNNIFPEYGYSEVSNVGFAYISADVQNVDEFYEVVENVLSKDIDENIFNNYKNKNIGKVIKSFNSVENINRMLVDEFINEYTIDQMIDDLKDLTYKDVIDYSKQIIDLKESVKVSIMPM